jgi:holo-[acyl-carrier protein] synthase
VIIGIGSDIVDVRRVKKVMARHEQRFIKRCFTETERTKAERRRNAGTHIDTYAKRFAAKEACSKALGTGFSQGVYMKDIGVVNEPSGKPGLELTGGALKRLQSLVPSGKRPVIHLTLTDEPPMVQAFVLIEAL